MKRDLAKPLSLMCLSALFAACGGESPKLSNSTAAPETTDASNDSPTNDSPTNALEGNWGTGCKGAPVLLQALAAGSIKAATKEIKVDGSSMNYMKTYFSDANCTKPLGQMTQHGQHKEGDALATGQNARAIDITIEKTDFTLNTEDAAKIFNELRACGLDGWTANHPMDITGKECLFGSTPKSGATHYTAYKIENNSLYLGDYDCSEGTVGCRSITSAEEANVGRESELKVVYNKL